MLPIQSTYFYRLSVQFFHGMLKSSFFLLGLLLFLLQAEAQVSDLSTIRVQKIAWQKDTIRIDSLSIIPNTFSIQGIDSSNYFLDATKALLVLHSNEHSDSLELHYRVFPILFGKRYFHKDAKRIEQNFALTPYYYNALDANTQGSFVDFGNLNYNGSFGRALSFGNSQDVVLNSQFNLQLDGDLGDSIKLLGAITDNTIPFQPEGNTQQLQEFDRVSIQLQRKRATLIVGDYDIKKPTGYFMNFYKRVQGGFFSSSFKTSTTGENKVAAGISLAKGKFVKNTITALEGNQGPYKLIGANGEQFFIILAGTERVYIDGKQQKRGEEFDYIIDYNTAEITFMPKRLVTKDLRITVEFEYSDKNYLNSLLYLNDEWTINKKVQVRFNVYSNQDAKSQSLQQTLDSTQKRFLASLGDSIQNAFYPSVRFEDTFSNSKILYKKIDTSIGSILYSNVYVFSTNKDSAKYYLNFSFVGSNKGHYQQSVNSANGRVYAWIAPVQGVPQGDYEPIQILVTPKRQQLFTFGTSYQIDSLKSLNVEAALSNSDPNTFSAIDNPTHAGLACKVNYNETRVISKKNELTLSSKVDYEFVQERFKPLERYRNVEFARDWNITPQDKNETEHLGALSFSLAKNQLGSFNYQYGTYFRGNSFKGIQHIASVIMNKKGYHILAKGDVMQQHSILYKSTYYRPYIEFEKLIKQQLVLGTKFLQEENQWRDAQSDSLLKAAFSFNEKSVYLKFNSKHENSLMASYTLRNDHAVKHNEFEKSSRGQTFSLNANLISVKNHDLKVTSSYRTLRIEDTSLTLQKPDESLLGRIEYNFSTFKGLLSGNLLYEFGSGQEQKREFAYLEVPAGQGMYVWRDYNKDSLKQLNEFELAIFQDEKLYIKVYTPTNQYVKAKYSLYNQSISLNPKALFNKTKMNVVQDAVSRVFVQSTIQLNNRFVGKQGLTQYNPFIQQFDDSLLINNASSIVNTVFINRFSNLWGLDYIQTIASGKTLLNYGIDARKNKEHQVRARYNITKQITYSVAFKTGSKYFRSQFLENRNYNIQIQSAEPAFSFLFKNNTIRFQTGYKYDVRSNSKNLGGQKAIANNVNVELKYNILSSGAISSRITFSSIEYNAENNTGISYTMLDGLQKGKNWLWQASFNKRLSKNIEMNLEYEGRKPATNSVIHTGRASVRAIF